MLLLSARPCKIIQIRCLKLFLRAMGKWVSNQKLLIMTEAHISKINILREERQEKICNDLPCRWPNSVERKHSCKTLDTRMWAVQGSGHYW